MASLTIRNLDEKLKSKLRLRAAQHGCSMEAEVRNILAQTLNEETEERNLAASIRKRFQPTGFRRCSSETTARSSTSIWCGAFRSWLASIL